LGFSDVWLTEHYFTGESVYNDSLCRGGTPMKPAAFASASRSCRRRFIIRAPGHAARPVDNLSKGRIDVGLGKGTVYNEYEFGGPRPAQRRQRERMEEAVDHHQRAWTARLRTTTASSTR